MNIQPKPEKPVMRLHRHGYWICRYKGNEVQSLKPEFAYKAAIRFASEKVKGFIAERDFLVRPINF